MRHSSLHVQFHCDNFQVVAFLEASLICQRDAYGLGTICSGNRKCYWKYSCEMSSYLHAGELDVLRRLSNPRYLFLLPRNGEILQMKHTAYFFFFLFLYSNYCVVGSFVLFLNLIQLHLRTWVQMAMIWKLLIFIPKAMWFPLAPYPPPRTYGYLVTLKRYLEMFLSDYMGDSLGELFIIYY